MVFFASNFIVLISVCGILYAVFHLWRSNREKRSPS
jgi:hypothetical protein